MNRTLLIVLLISIGVSGAVLAGEFPEYPQFRYSSGLPGGGFGVDPLGRIGFDGALQTNIPIGYTPGFGNIAIVAASAAFDGGFPGDLSGPDVNGTVSFGAGVLRDPAVWFTYMGTGAGAGLEPAYNLQVQLLRETARYPAVAIGGIDLNNHRAADLSDPFKGNARSFFIAATREGGTPDAPLYYTLGLGNGRFHGPFGGVSYQPLDRLSVFAEYDGWNPNAGFAYDVFRYKNDWHGVFSLSVIDLERINISLALTKTEF
jgi:hypothetical protein